MSRLTIAIPTFRRPEDLKRAVGGVLEQASELAAGPTAEASGPRTDAEAGTEGDAAGATDAKGGAGEDVSDIEVLVIDNDAQGSGREAALAAAADAGVPVRFPADAPVESGGMSVRYVVEERPGVAAVRNRALDETAERDLLIFIDDDEDPEPGWLAALVGLWASTGCQAVAGPVIPVYEVEPEEWVRQGEFFVRRTWPTGTVRPVAASNCLLLDLGFVRRAGLRFDEAFGATGGEDTLFTRRLRAAGVSSGGATRRACAITSRPPDSPGPGSCAGSAPTPPPRCESSWPWQEAVCSLPSGPGPRPVVWCASSSAACEQPVEPSSAAPGTLPKEPGCWPVAAASWRPASEAASTASTTTEAVPSESVSKGESRSGKANG